MRTLQTFVLAPLFVLAVACGGPPPAAPTRSSECDVINSKLKALDAAKQSDPSHSVSQNTTALVAALEKLSADLEADIEKGNIVTPELKTAAAGLAAASRDVAAMTKGMTATFDEIDKVSQSIESWQKKVAAAAAEFDKACANGPKEECEKLGAELKKSPRLDGAKFDKYATALEAFTTTVDGLKAEDAKVQSSLAALNATLKEGIRPSRRMNELLNELKKLDPVSQKLEAQRQPILDECGSVAQ
ncbi:hypothetical protein KEG38_52070 [Polyangium jinanense]|uniref:hypothetical protein n=1 Tax=Polyangium jinanense TaxID=2829994 RepID=UPI0023428254|nr:hypothetical protein [Polyangium jinanense]MDC3962462.1 hypothetical protein [Polyangium jinanense]